MYGDVLGFENLTNHIQHLKEPQEHVCLFISLDVSLFLLAMLPQNSDPPLIRGLGEPFKNVSHASHCPVLSEHTIASLITLEPLSSSLQEYSHGFVCCSLPIT